MKHVLVLHATLPAGPCPVALLRLLERLPYARRLELEARDPDARCASLVGIALALRGAQDMRAAPVDAGRLAFPAGGKPVLAGGPDFSVSHAGRYVGVALCGEGVVGFDLEPVDGRAGDPATSRSRLLRWTATEAVLKAAGRGLRDTRHVVLGDSLRSGQLGDASFHLSAVAISDDVVACLATATAADLVRVERVEASALAP